MRTMPDDVRRLAKRMQRISRGRGVLSPADDSLQLRGTIGIGDEEEDEELFADLFQPERAEYGEAPSLAEIKRVVGQAKRQHDLIASEAAWNSAVHHPILVLAWSGSPYSDKQDWDNITTASIQAKTFMSNLAEKGVLPSKKVDFCLTFTPEQHALFRRAEIALNQTHYFPILCNPIAVSIETKIPDSGAADGKRQLLTWVSAQVARLRELLRICGHLDVEIPLLPLILVQGHTWSFVCFKSHSRGSEDDGGDSATFYDGGIEIGSTDHVQGAYQIVAALQLLMHWTASEYQVWMDRWVLQPLTALLQGLPVDAEAFNDIAP